MESPPLHRQRPLSREIDSHVQELLCDANVNRNRPDIVGVETAANRKDRWTLSEFDVCWHCHERWCPTAR